MLAEKRLQIRRQQFTEAGCRAADVGLHDYNSTKRIHRTPSILWAAGLQPITSASFSSAILPTAAFDIGQVFHIQQRHRIFGRCKLGLQSFEALPVSRVMLSPKVRFTLSTPAVRICEPPMHSRARMT